MRRRAARLKRSRLPGCPRAGFLFVRAYTLLSSARRKCATVFARPSARSTLGDQPRISRARRFDGPFDDYVAAYNAKYSWTFRADDETFVVHGTVEVVPSRVLAWRGATAALPPTATTPAISESGTA